MNTEHDTVYFLLVDDLEENLMSLEALLRRDGLVLLKAHSGREALELLLRHDVALALLDVQMPVMDGFELAELMRGTERTRNVPIIFVTAGSADRQRRFRGYEAGAVDFIHKPIEPDILRSKADIFFDLYRQRQQVARQRDELKLAYEKNAALLQESRHYAQALKEADIRKDEFLAVLAHELRNPLAPIRNGLQILKMSPSEQISQETREMMDRQLTHMVRLIDDLLDISRISQGKIDLRKQQIILQDIIKSAIESSKPLIENGKHELKINIPEQKIWLEGDLTRLAQAISNVLNNAAKYTNEGGLIAITVTLDGSNVLIAIADNGLGIRSDMLPKVFELFTQVDHNLERSQGGLGIGLALVKNLVEMHGGSIKAQSDGLNKGSVFTFRLPISETMPATQSGGAETSLNDSQQQLKILVVDDNIASAKTTGWMLEMIGHAPTLVHDGLEALEVARKSKFDVILLDIGLPGMNGYDICKELRKDSGFKDTLMIAQTGWGQEKDRRLAYEAGFNHHLTKPVNFEEFAQLISNAKNN